MTFSPIPVICVLGMLALLNGVMCTYASWHAKNPECPEPARNARLYQLAGGAGAVLAMYICVRVLRYSADTAWAVVCGMLVLAITTFTVGRAWEIHKECRKVRRRWAGQRQH